MTWYLDTKTGELYGPNGEVRTTVEGPPYRIPNDPQRWVEREFRKKNMADLTTDVIADYAQLWQGDIETGTPPES